MAYHEYLQTACNNYGVDCSNDDVVIGIFDQLKVEVNSDAERLCFFTSTLLARVQHARQEQTSMASVDESHSVQWHRAHCEYRLVRHSLFVSKELLASGVAQSTRSPSEEMAVGISSPACCGECATVLMKIICCAFEAIPGYLSVKESRKNAFLARHYRIASGRHCARFL